MSRARTRPNSVVLSASIVNAEIHSLFIFHYSLKSKANAELPYPPEKKSASDFSRACRMTPNEVKQSFTKWATLAKQAKRVLRVKLKIGNPQTSLKTPRSAQPNCLGSSNWASGGGFTFRRRCEHINICDHCRRNAKRRIKPDFKSPMETLGNPQPPKKKEGPPNGKSGEPCIICVMGVSATIIFLCLLLPCTSCIRFHEPYRPFPNRVCRRCR